MENEHFGYGPAEMTRAGCLVFAHNSGGSTEVLNTKARCYGNGETKPFARSPTPARRSVTRAPPFARESVRDRNL